MTQPLEQSAKIKLLQLVQAVQPVVDQHLADMQSGEVEYILKHYRNYLKLDLERDFERARKEKPLSGETALEDILSDFRLDKNKS